MAEIAFNDDLSNNRTAEQQLPASLREVVHFTAQFLEKRFAEALETAEPLQGRVKTTDHCNKSICQTIQIDIREKKSLFIKNFHVFLKRFLFANDGVNYNHGNGSIRYQMHPGSDWLQYDDLPTQHCDDLLLVLCYAKKSRSRNARHLDLIAQRIKHLMPNSGASLHNNPIDPVNFLKTFMSTCNALHFSAEEKQLLFQYFDLKICRKFTDLFKCINQIFVSHDILANLESDDEVRPTPVPKKMLSQKVLLNKRQSQQDVLVTQVLIAILKEYHQTHQAKFAERLAPVIVDFQQMINSRVQRQNKMFNASFVSDRDQLILGKTRRYFEQIFADQSLPSTFKAQLARLQIVFAIQALKDPALLTNSSHFLRKLFMSIQQQTFDWVDLNDKTHLPAARARECIDKICRNYPSDTKKLAELAENFVIESIYNEKIKLVEKRTLQTEAGRHRLQEANAEIYQLLSNFFDGKHSTHPIERFLNGAWRPFMVLVYLKEGTEGENWKQHVETILTLLAPFQQEQKEQVVLDYNKQIKVLRNYTTTVFEHLNTSVEKKRVLTRCLHPINAKDVTPYRNHFNAQLEGPRIRLPFQLAKTLLRLKRGAWLEYVDADNIRHRVQYLCSAEGSSSLIFLSRHGQPLQVLSMTTLNRLKQTNRLRFLDDLEISCTL